MTGLWRITTLLIVAKARGETPTVAGESLKFHSRITEQAKRYGDITVALRKPPSQNPLYNPNPFYGQVEQIGLIADVPVPAGWTGPPQNGAIERFTPVFETLIDLIAFDMATVPGVGQVDMIDITTPVAIGDNRTELSLSAPPYDRYKRAMEMVAIHGRLMGELPDAVDNLDSKTAAVQRWFVKALGTDLLHDQVIFLWIALEILCDDSDVRVEEPYVGPCQHQIPVCPECGRATTKMVRGATIKKFLQGCGVPEQQANELWRMRQLMHGAIPFDSKKLENLGGLIQPLRAVVAAGLKIRLGKAINEPPLVAAAGFLLHPAIGLGGTRRIIEDDIRPLIPQTG